MSICITRSFGVPLGAFVSDATPATGGCKWHSTQCWTLEMRRLARPARRVAHKAAQRAMLTIVIVSLSVKGLASAGLLAFFAPPAQVAPRGAGATGPGRRGGAGP